MDHQTSNDICKNTKNFKRQSNVTKHNGLVLPKSNSNASK